MYQKLIDARNENTRRIAEIKESYILGKGTSRKMKSADRKEIDSLRLANREIQRQLRNL